MNINYPAPEPISKIVLEYYYEGSDLATSIVWDRNKLTKPSYLNEVMEVLDKALIDLEKKWLAESKEED